MCSTCDPVMNYAVPFWVSLNEDQEIILNLDDWKRSNTLFMNVIMGLIQWGEYMSWKLPKKCHFVMKVDSFDCTYSTNIDFESTAILFLTLKADFDDTIWAKWAQTNNINSTMINFTLLCPEVFERDPHINSRSNFKIY